MANESVDEVVAELEKTRARKQPAPKPQDNTPKRQGPNIKTLPDGSSYYAPAVYKRGLFTRRDN